VSGRCPDAEQLATFVRLSEVLLDARGLSQDAAREYYAIVRRAAPTSYGSTGVAPMTALLDTFCRVEADGPDDLEARTVAVLYADGVLATMAKNLLITWYNGGLGLDVAPATVYADALVWPAIGAEPPGLPGRYYGSWAFPPPLAVWALETAESPAAT
jgi:hypothetical protein